MQPLLLSLSLKEWIKIGIISLFFSILLSLLCYFLLSESLLQGLFFGTLLGLCLLICAVLLTTLLNQNILPTLPKHYWLLSAALSSFFSGFLATWLCYTLSLLLHVKLLVKFESHLFLFSFLIGVLSYAVAFLLYQFVMMSYAKEYHEKLLIQSRLKSLERQLNPHFLFNALNSLTELLHVNPNKAEDALLELSDFLRSSMKENALISLKEELENVKRYVGLENIRFDGKIILRTELSEHVLTQVIPKFSIQLLVENAIKHGFYGDTLHIVVVGYFEENSLVLNVQNDGKTIKTSHFGIGLTNLQERLKLLCYGTLKLISNDKPLFEIRTRRAS